MRNYFKNLLAAIRGRRGQASISSVVSSIEAHIETLRGARTHVYNETFANDGKIEDLRARNKALFDDANRSIRLEGKLREFIA